jgi:polyphosphate kinase
MADKSKSSLPYSLNRDLSWLMFNQRVLDEASDPYVPLFERLRFLSICKSNLDEFFMIRIGSQFDILNVKPDAIDWRSGRPIIDMIRSLYRRSQRQLEHMDKVYVTLVEECKQANIHVVEISSLSKDEKRHTYEIFQQQIAPILSPQVIDAMHPFPHIQNNKMHVGLVLKRKSRRMYGIIPVPELSSNYVELSGSTTKYIALEEIVLYYSDQIFHNYDVEERTLFHLYRNADINFDEEYYDETVNLKVKMKQLLNKRNQLFPVRIDVSIPTSVKFTRFLATKVNASNYQFLKRQTPLAVDHLMELITKDVKQRFPQHLFAPFTPRLPQWYDSMTSMTDILLQRDVLLHFPYDSMEPFLRLIYESAMDSQVISIKITIYRLAKTAKLIEYLSLAAELGKEVLVVMELRARFDEQNNIDWSERLERAGCKIVYGLDVYKVHSKICLITRKVKQKLVMLTQVGTGNYNESTVGQYTDFSLMTSHYDIGLDAAKFFTNISIGAAEGSYHHLLVSPFQIKDQLLRLIEEQIQYGSAGYIRFKINAITDKDLIVALVKASQNGVKIEMITRSISCIRPHVRGWTESIHVISLVGRFLEHARVYQFGQGDDALLYISSADLMTRNMERRIEVAIPVYDTQIKRQIQEVLTLQTLDNVKARYLSSKGKHIPVSTGLPTFDVQESFLFGKN